MEFLIKPGRILFGIAMASFGLTYLIYASGGHWPIPGPPWFPGRIAVAYIAGAALLIAGIGLAFNIQGRCAALALGIGLLIRVLICHLPRVLVNLHDPGPWTSGAEILSMSGGAFVLAGALTGKSSQSQMRDSIWDALILAGQLLFALPLFVFGAQHLIYGQFVATLIPSWIPAHVLWAYFIGAAFIATALAIITRQLGALASSLLGGMFLLWVLILHIPRVAASPHNGNEWTSAFVALAMSGAAFAVGGTLAARE